MTLKDHFLSQCPHDLKLLRLLYIKWQNQNSSTADNSESVYPDLHLSPTNPTHQSIEPFNMDSVHKMRQRERSQNSELYESRIEILGSSLFLQSVLPKLHRQHIQRLWMTLSNLIQHYKTVATSIPAIQLTTGTTKLLNVTGNITWRRHVIHTDVYQNYIYRHGVLLY